MAYIFRKPLIEEKFSHLRTFLGMTSVNEELIQYGCSSNILSYWTHIRHIALLDAYRCIKRI